MTTEKAPRNGVIELPNKKYDLIYLDPPWSYNREVGQGVAIEQYNTMEIREIMQLPINQLLKENGIVFLWVTFPKLNEVFDVINTWNLKYCTVGFNWIKKNDDGSPFFGIGYYTKSNGEICLILKKGKGLKIKDNTISQIIFSKKDSHSKKPKVCYVLLEKLFGDIDRLELFARHKREGWDAWGNEVPNEEQKVLK